MISRLSFLAALVVSAAAAMPDKACDFSRLNDKLAVRDFIARVSFFGRERASCRQRRRRRR